MTRGLPMIRLPLTQEARDETQLAQICGLLATALPVATSPVRAETIDVSDSHGGSVAQYDAHGGLQKDFVWMHAPDVFKYLKNC